MPRTVLKSLGYEAKIMDALDALEASSDFQALDSAQRDDARYIAIQLMLQPLYGELTMLRGETM